MFAVTRGADVSPGFRCQAQLLMWLLNAQPSTLPGGMESSLACKIRVRHSRHASNGNPEAFRIRK